jgi:hypothetical protein
MGFCVQCGQEYQEGLKFCTSCGAKIEQKGQVFSQEKKSDSPVVAGSPEPDEPSIKIVFAIGLMIACFLVALFIGYFAGKSVEKQRNKSVAAVQSSNGITTAVSDHPAIGLFNAFLNDVNAKNWESAYSRTSDRARIKRPYKSFINNWSNNLRIQLNELQVVKTLPGKVKIYVLLTSSDSNVKTHKEERFQYEGIVKMVEENGQWKITDPVMSAVRRTRE